MQFLRDNKRLIYALLLLPLFFLYLDRFIMLWLKGLKDTYPSLYSILHAIDPYAIFFYYLMIVFAIITVGLRKLVRRDLWKSLFYGLIITSLTIQVKHLLGRARPKLGYETVFTGPSFKYVYSSFPSGHTAFVFMLSAILSGYYPRYRFILYGLSLWIGFERIEDSAHFPSDVLAGAILGLLIGRFVLFRFGRIEIKDD
jgi:membrane-associated phospholipid phosphatase